MLGYWLGGHKTHFGYLVAYGQSQTWSSQARSTTGR
jgi:hypothetical protein